MGRTKNGVACVLQCGNQACSSTPGLSSALVWQHPSSEASDEAGCKHCQDHQGDANGGFLQAPWRGNPSESLSSVDRRVVESVRHFGDKRGQVGMPGHRHLRCWSLWWKRTAADQIKSAITGVFGSVKPNFSVAACIAAEALDTNSDKISVVYNTFVNTITQDPTAIGVPSYKLISEGSDVDPFQTYETEDERSETLESLTEFNTAVTIYAALLENNCSEIASKMTAMDNATRNANDMFDALELKYNKARQAAITTELIEIISGAESLKG